MYSSFRRLARRREWSMDGRYPDVSRRSPAFPSPYLVRSKRLLTLPRYSNASITSVRQGSGGLYRLAFGRPSLCGTLDQLQQQGSDVTESYFNSGVLCSPLTI